MAGRNRVARLAPREAALLSALVRAGGAPVSEEGLLEGAWGWNNARQLRTATVKVHVSRLRRKIEDAGGDPACIANVRYEGYRYDESRDAGGVAAAAALRAGGRLAAC